MWCGCGRTKRTRSPRPRSSTSCFVAITSASPSMPLAPPTMTSMASPRGSWASARTARSGAFSGWIRPTNNTTGRSVGRPTARRAPAPVAGCEEGVLDGRRDDLDAAGGIAVQPAELTLLLGAAHADGVAAPDDLGLGLIAPARLEVATLRLDPGQRVERRDQRQVEVVLEPVTDDPAQPVVAVDDVDAGPGQEVLADPAGELVDLLRERLLRQVERSGRDVHDAVPRLDHHLGGQARAVGPGVRRALDAGLGERRCHLADVDVHATTVPGPGLDQRRGVQRDHRHPLHGARNATQQVRTGPARSGGVDAVGRSSSGRRSSRRR